MRPPLRSVIDRAALAIIHTFVVWAVVPAVHDSWVTTAGAGEDPVERWVFLVDRYFEPEDVAMALQIIACESGGDPNADNPSSSAAGLFQHLDDWYEGRWWPHTFDPFDPEQSVRYGAELFYESGIGNWNASRSCWGGGSGYTIEVVDPLSTDLIARGG